MSARRYLHMAKTIEERSKTRTVYSMRVSFKISSLIITHLSRPPKRRLNDADSEALSSLFASRCLEQIDDVDKR